VLIGRVDGTGTDLARQQLRVVDDVTIAERVIDLAAV
jgi:hypothetical protein